MANSRISVIGNGILRRYFEVEEFLKFNEHLFHLPINPVVGPKMEDFDSYNDLEKDLKEIVVGNGCDVVGAFKYQASSSVMEQKGSQVKEAQIIQIVESTEHITHGE